jgi:hypothetical protein
MKDYIFVERHENHIVERTFRVFGRFGVGGWTKCQLQTARFVFPNGPEVVEKYIAAGLLTCRFVVASGGIVIYCRNNSKYVATPLPETKIDGSEAPQPILQQE